MSAPAKPLPQMTPLERPYWEYTRRHELRLQKCGACGALRFPASAVCPECFSDTAEWARVSGRGRVLSWVVFHRSYFPAFEADVPYNVVMIALDEGPVVISTIVGIANEGIRKGLRVEATFEDVTPEISIPRFRPVEE
ncbi:MAG: OB-fold domain-containing protein [Proteobacteria bacterium]|nr:OB-fold domain-containing protein [Pseudomonadota bacterium]